MSHRLPLSYTSRAALLVTLLTALLLFALSANAQQVQPYVIKTDTGLDECPRAGKSSCLERLFKGSYSGSYYLAHDNGLEVVLERDRIRTYIFYVDTPGKAPFNGRNDKGIGKGSNMDDVIRAYGAPEERSAPPEPPIPGRARIIESYFDYGSLGITFSFADERLIDIRVYTVIPPGADPFADPFADLSQRAGGALTVARELVQHTGHSHIYAANIRSSQSSQLKKLGVSANVITCFNQRLTLPLIERHLSRAFADEFTTDQLREGLTFYKTVSGKRFADTFRISTLELLLIPTEERLPELSKEDRQNIAAFTRTPVGQQSVDPQANVIRRAAPDMQRAVSELLEQCNTQKAKH
ncbi:hypothetical protein [Viridibacterium curvum]